MSGKPIRTPAPSYLLMGPEEGEKGEFIASIKQALTQVDPSLEIHTIYPWETGMSELAGILKNGSLFSSWKLVILRNGEQVKREEGKILGEYLKNPAPEVCLIITTSNLEKDISKPVASAIPKDRKKIFWELFENQKRAWLTKYFRGKEIEVSPEGMELILDLVENNTKEMRAACDQLSLFFGPGSCIGEEDVDTFIHHSREENVFTLFGKMADLDFISSLETLRKLMLSGENNPIQLYAGLLWQFKRLLKLSSMTDLQYSVEDACMKIGIRGKKNQESYRRANSHYSTGELKRIILLISRFDALVRETRAEMQSLLMELFLYYTILKKGELPEAYR